MPHERKCCQTKMDVTRPITWMTLPATVKEYQDVANDRKAFRHWIDTMLDHHPELFPDAMVRGYTLHDIRASRKMPAVRFRRICLNDRDPAGKKQVFTIVPSGVMPYLTVETDHVEQALFLRRFAVPCWALTYVVGRNDADWYRLETQFGRGDLVHTVVTVPHALPQHVLADEKIPWRNGDDVVVATTVGAECILGASVALSATTEALTDADDQFKQEAHQVDPTYAPSTVNTDGWTATQNAWRRLFPTIVMLECFLHADLKIRERGRHLHALFAELAHHVWDTYRAPDAASFRLKVAALRHWAEQHTTGAVLAAVTKLSAKGDRFVVAYEHPDAHRTSKMLDRHVHAMSRWLDRTRFFHGHWVSAERSIRAWALFHNFGPYCPRAKVTASYSSPVHQLNGFVYHENWLHNLLIATSMSGVSG